MSWLTQSLTITVAGKHVEKAIRDVVSSSKPVAPRVSMVVAIPRVMRIRMEAGIRPG
jgi:hypothetical protein